MPDSFVQASKIETESKAILLPFIQERAHNGQFVVCSKGPLARSIQEVIGDVIYNSSAERIWTVELKAERTAKYGNFFLETWSNRNLEDRGSHSHRGSNLGWLFKLRSDLLFYHFLDEDELYIFDFFKLKQWAFGTVDRPGQIFSFPERCQAKYPQHNDTWGRCVKIEVLTTLGLAVLIHPNQIPLFPELEPALF